MSTPKHPSTLPVLVLFLSACGMFGSSAGEPPEPEDAPMSADADSSVVAAQEAPPSRDDSGISFEKGAIVLTGRALEDGSGTVLAAMNGKVPSMRVRLRANECPEIAFRNHVNFTGAVLPAVYVDGTHATNTCILETLRTSDVERVEVYPQGFTTRPGYGRDAHGLILVFMRST